MRDQSALTTLKTRKGAHCARGLTHESRARHHSGMSRYRRSLVNGDVDRSASRVRRREADLWQRRFWEHQIRDEVDFERHVNYVHYNPVKHGLVTRAVDWPYSTFHRYMRRGIFPTDWAVDPGEVIGDAGE